MCSFGEARWADVCIQKSTPFLAQDATAVENRAESISRYARDFRKKP
jgi:hypothetical protein